MSERRLLVKVEAERYRRARKKEKGRILDDFCGTTELERKHAIKVLRAGTEMFQRVGRKPNYGPETHIKNIVSCRTSFGFVPLISHG